nr:unnamed protein product [Digitaria exilis]
MYPEHTRRQKETQTTSDPGLTEVELPEGSAPDLLPELELPPDHLLHPGSQTRKLALHTHHQLPTDRAPARAPPHLPLLPDPSRAPQAARQADRIAPAPLASIGPSRKRPPNRPSSRAARSAARHPRRNASQPPRRGRRLSRSRGDGLGIRVGEIRGEEEVPRLD